MSTYKLETQDISRFSKLPKYQIALKKFQFIKKQSDFLHDLSILKQIKY